MHPTTRSAPTRCVPRDSGGGPGAACAARERTGHPPQNDQQPVHARSRIHGTGNGDDRNNSFLRNHPWPSLDVLGQPQAEPDEVDPISGGVMAPIGRAQVGGIAPPGTATHNSIISSRRANRIKDSRFQVMVVAIRKPVRAPLPHVSGHVVRPAPARSRRPAPDRLRCNCSTEHSPTRIGRRVSPRILCSSCSPRRIFPLRFRRQSASRPAGIRYRLIPRHPNHRLTQCIESRVNPEPGPLRFPSSSHVPLVLFVRHRVLVQPEPSGDPD